MSSLKVNIPNADEVLRRESKDGRVGELDESRGLVKRVAELEANKEILKKEQKVDADSLAGQVEALVERLEIIANDAIVKTKAKLMTEYKKGKIDQQCPDEAITVWEEPSP
ncbi:hypothetical protein ACOSQ4_003234 [Xanthoceras sorbifolium]